MEITDPDGSTRNVNAMTVSGWIKNIAAENGPFFDVVPAQVSSSNSKYYSDRYYQASDNSLVLARSYFDSNAYGGVAYSGAGKYASSQDLAYGSRLAFRGTISEVSPEQFKKNYQHYNIIF